jgi:hypothetical protein
MESVKQRIIEPTPSSLDGKDALDIGAFSRLWTALTDRSIYVLRCGPQVRHDASIYRLEKDDSAGFLQHDWFVRCGFIGI